MTLTEIARAFSVGAFEETYDHLAADAVWEVVGENTFEGKKAIVAQYEQVGHYFKTVTTRFKTLHTISEGQQVVVSGTAEFLRDHKRISFVSACDLYAFNELNQIQRITSYCIQSV